MLISALLTSDIPSNIQLNSSFTIYIFIIRKTVPRLKDLPYPHERREYITLCSLGGRNLPAS